MKVLPVRGFFLLHIGSKDAIVSKSGNTTRVLKEVLIVLNPTQFHRKSNCIIDEMQTVLE